MSTPDRDDRDIESLLRRALHEQAERVQPVGDGLAKIQRRAAGRRRRRLRLRPSLAVLAAAVAVVAALGVPSLLHRSQPGNGTDTAASPPTRSTVSATPKLGRPTPSQATSTPRAAYLPAWPYGSKTEALNSKRTAAQQSPQALATSFVYSFVSAVALPGSVPVKLAANAPHKQGRGLAVDVTRPDRSRPICQVQLSRLTNRTPATYVVTGAQTSDLTVRATTAAQGVESVGVGGTYSQPSDAPATQLWSALVSPDGTTTPKLLGSTADDPAARWSTQLNLPSAVQRPTIVASWTVDTNGNVLDFAAAGAD